MIYNESTCCQFIKNYYLCKIIQYYYLLHIYKCIYYLVKRFAAGEWIKSGISIFITLRAYNNKSNRNLFRFKILENDI